MKLQKPVLLLFVAAVFAIIIIITIVIVIIIISIQVIINIIIVIFIIAGIGIFVKGKEDDKLFYKVSLEVVHFFSTT